MLDILIGTVINVALLVLWSLIFYFLVQKKAIILSGVILGIVVFMLAGGIEYFWGDLTGISLTEKQSKAVVAPVLEESFKLLFIFLVFRFSRRGALTERRTCTVFGASLGLGFAFIENFGYVANFLNVLSRAFSSWVIHMMTATILAYGVYYVRESKRNLAWVLIFLMIAMVIHGLFNFVVLLLGYH